MTEEYTFATAINCIDGRTQQPVSDWIKEHYPVQFVDMVTEPGADGALASGEAGLRERLKAKVQISVDAHHSRLVVVAGHHECAANPVSREEHYTHIRNAARRIAMWGFPVAVVGLWVGPDWKAEAILTYPART